MGGRILEVESESSQVSLGQRLLGSAAATVRRLGCATLGAKAWRMDILQRPLEIRE